MYEHLAEPFRQLARTMHSVEAWTDQMLEVKTLSSKDRLLIAKLRKYVLESRRDQKNWTQKKAAQERQIKLDHLWASILLDVIMPSDKKK